MKDRGGNSVGCARYGFTYLDRTAIASSVALKASYVRSQGAALARIRDSAHPGTDWRASVTKERLEEELQRMPSQGHLPDRTGDTQRGVRIWNLTKDRIVIDWDETGNTNSARPWDESCRVDLERELPHWQHSTHCTPGSTFRISGCGHPTTCTVGTASVQIVFVVTSRSPVPAPATPPPSLAQVPSSPFYILVLRGASKKTNSERMVSN